LTKAFWLLLAGSIAFKVAVISSETLDLSFDEAYYWHWSKRLDFCYYSKGPGIALLIAGTTAIAGDTPLGVRLGSVICSSLAAIIAFHWLGSFFGSRKPALLAVMLMGASPMFGLGGMLTTIDSPFFLCWTAATAALWWAVRSDSKAAWVLTGVAIAAGLLFKFTMFFFPVGMLLFLWISREDRPRLKTAGPWLALGVGLAGLAPVIWWNSQHEWITLRHTAEKGTTEQTVSWFTLRHVVPSFFVQMGTVSPVIYVGLLIALGYLVHDLSRGTRTDPPVLDGRRARFLTAGMVPVFGFYTVLAFHRSIPPNWPVVGYLAAFAAGGWYWARPWDRFQRVTFTAAIGVGVAMQLPLVMGDALYRSGLPEALQARGMRFPIKADPTNQLKGWSELGKWAGEQADAFERETGKRVFIAADHYSYAAWAGFYNGTPDRVFSLLHRGELRNQFHMWWTLGRRPTKGDNAVIVYEEIKGYGDQWMLVHPHTPVFERWENDGRQLIVRRGETEIRRFGMFRCYGWRGPEDGIERLDLPPGGK